MTDGPLEIVYTADEIAATVRRVAARIAADHRRAHGDAPLLFVGVLKGALIFTADLVRALPPEIDARLDLLAVSSYGDADRSSGEVRLLKDTSESIEGKHVVIVEDIVDNGLTLTYLRALLESRGPASLVACALLDKPYRRRTDVRVDYVGLEAPDAFIVGYGLDYGERHRTLPYLAKLAPATT